MNIIWPNISKHEEKNKRPNNQKIVISIGTILNLYKLLLSIPTKVLPMGNYSQESSNIHQWYQKPWKKKSFQNQRKEKFYNSATLVDKTFLPHKWTSISRPASAKRRRAMWINQLRVKTWIFVKIYRIYLLNDLIFLELRIIG